MKKTGILLIALSLFIFFEALDMNVSVENIYNIGLLTERQNIIYLSGIIFLAGIILFGFGVVAKENKNINFFAAFAFMIPFVLFIGIKSILETKEANQQKEIESQIREKKQIEQAKPFIFIKNTGLMWQRCSFGQSWNGKECIGESKQMSWGEGYANTYMYAESVGYDNWRLPTKKELMSIIVCLDGKYNLDGSCKNKRATTINDGLFPDLLHNFWTSDEEQQTNILFAWQVDLLNGYPLFQDKGKKANILLVRDLY